MKQVIGGPITFKDGRTFPLSRAVVCSGLIFVSGQVAMDEDNKVVGHTIGEQTRQVIANIKAILATVGADLSDVIKATAWLTDPKDFAGFNEEYARHFSVAPPARSAVCSALVLPGYLVELEVVAAAPNRSE
jgi:2-iminobutanoate/2-iminopropanoate deaminase